MVDERIWNAETILDGIEAIGQWARSNPAIPEHERRAVLYRLEGIITAAVANKKFVVGAVKPLDSSKPSEPVKPSIPEATKNPPKPKVAPVFEK